MRTIRYVPTLVAAALIPAAQPVLLGLAVTSGTIVINQAFAKAQSQETASSIARAITVLIEGATQGSGVLIEASDYTTEYKSLPEGINEYTVLTAWHVVKGNAAGEEIYIKTSNNRSHTVDISKVTRIKDLDLALIRFQSNERYQVARTGTETVKKKDKLLVAGFPLNSKGKLFISKGQLEGQATFSLGGGYSLLYSNQTAPGMSGGPVLTSSGMLYGIHGQGELDVQKTEDRGIAVKTGINLGIPAYYRIYENNDWPYTPEVESKPKTPSDYILMAEMTKRRDSRETDEVVRIYDQGILLAQEWDSESLQLMHTMRAEARKQNGNIKGAVQDGVRVIEIAPTSYSAVMAYALLAGLHATAKEYDKSVKSLSAFIEKAENPSAITNLEYLGEDDFRELIAPMLSSAQYHLGALLRIDGEHLKAAELLQKSLDNDPEQIQALKPLGLSLRELGKNERSLVVLQRSLRAEPNDAKVLHVIGQILLEKGSNKASLDYLDAAILNDPQLYWAISDRAKAYLGLGDYRKAARDYSTVISKTSKTEDKVLYRALVAMRGYSYYKLNDISSACPDFVESYQLGNITSKAQHDYCVALYAREQH